MMGEIHEGKLIKYLCKVAIVLKNNWDQKKRKQKHINRNQELEV